MPPRNESLRAWQVAHEVALLVFKATAALPKREWFGLGAQIRKSAVSVPSNLAEGAGKLGPRELRKYADIAIGSYNELEYQLRLAVEMGLIGAEEHGVLQARLQELGKCLYGLVRSLGRGK